MRSLVAVAFVLAVACSPGSTATATQTSSSTASAAAQICKLPVWWATGTDVHGGFVSIPGGAFTDAGVLPPLVQPPSSVVSAQFYGATYVSSTKHWLRVPSNLLSPDRTQAVYWSNAQSEYSLHVVNTGSGADRLVYSGSTVLLPIAFESDAVYLAHAINLRQGALEKLYRLDPAGGTPQLVAGSDHHLYPWGWVMIADGAAWGVDYRVVGNDYFYSVLRLDLATSQVTQWLEGSANDALWPLGVDDLHRLYVSGKDSLLRVEAPHVAVSLPNPGPVSASRAPGTASDFVADSRGVWLASPGAVWLYKNDQDPKQFVVNTSGKPGEDVLPAGPCS